jgi:8-oxo-dGTP pyrophosphatase MutT (NUDIX family)
LSEDETQPRRSPDEAGRLIWLRRPPRVVASDEPFTPACAAAQVDDAWRERCRRNAKMTDGPTFHVVGVHRDGHGGATIHVVRTTYRMNAVRAAGVATGFVGLGTRAVAHWKGACLVGLRDGRCASYPNEWEFAPAGSVEPGEDPAAGIERELLEECGVQAAGRAVALAIFFDPVVASWEIVHELRMAQPPDAPPNWEYQRLELAPLSRLPRPLTACARQMLPIAQRLMHA